MLNDKLNNLAKRVSAYDGKLETEEATKNALVMPFIQALGYDVFDPDEVIPEYTADVGTKRGEKVDYVVKHDGDVIMLFEAKRASTNLGETHASQLFRYFTVTNARIAVLTNGIEYWFYSDLDATNKMDDRPFLILDLRDMREGQVAQLKKLTKEHYDLNNILSIAGDLKYMAEIRRVLEEQLATPDEAFVRYFFSAAAPGRKFLAAAREQFTPLVTKAFESLIHDRVSERLRSALQQTAPPAPAGAESPSTKPEAKSDPAAPASADGIVTTEEELQGFRIVKAIVCSVLEPSRVQQRDAKSYFAVICDDNNRKPICRLHFNGVKKYLGILDEQKNETKHLLDSGPEGIYGFADELRKVAGRYVEQSAGGGD